MPDFHPVEENLRAAMRLFALASPAGECRDMPGVSIVSTGLNHAMFNSAMLTSQVPGEHGGLDRRIMIAKVHFAARGLRWSLWLCEDLLDRATRRRVDTVCGMRGMRQIVQPPGMIAERLQPPHRALPELEYLPVDGAPARLAFCSITSESFDLPLATSREIYDSEAMWTKGYRGFLGYFEGRPVTTAALVVAAGVIGVYSVATSPQFRRRGFAEAVVRHALEQVRKETGLETTVLQTTRVGQPLYERMGYRVVTRFSVFS